MTPQQAIAILDRHANELPDLAKAKELASVARYISAQLGADAHLRGAIKLLFRTLRDDEWSKQAAVEEVKRLYSSVPSAIIKQIADGHDKAADAEYRLWCEIISRSLREDFKEQRR